MKGARERLDLYALATTGRSLGASRAAAQYHIASWPVLPRLRRVMCQGKATLQY